jgi:hypothetical protein
MNELTDGAEIRPAQQETNPVHSEPTKLPLDEANPLQLEDRAAVRSQDTSKAETEPTHEERNRPESSTPQVEAKQAEKMRM